MGRLRPTLILGGPGCGKTTRLLEIVEEALDKGVSPDRIAFVAFTRKAAQEARSRMMEKFEVEEEAIPYFRTLHSFAFSFLDVERSQIVDSVKLRAYAKAGGLNLSSAFVDEFGQSHPAPSTVDDQILSAYSLARVMEVDLAETLPADIGYSYAAKIAADYDEWKDEAMLVDFTDMIEKFCAEAIVPPFELLIVDEAQDLSRLQWSMVDKLVENSKDVYFAGDDDQAIYEWAGADVERFLSLDADRVILPTSYRLKQEVFYACQRVIARCRHRYEKDWLPHATGGEIEFVSNLDALDMSKGTWYILSRTNSLVQRNLTWLRRVGLPYLTPTADGMKSSVAVDPARAVLVYENLKLGRQFSGKDLSLVWSYIRPKLRPVAAPVFDDSTEYGIDALCSTGFDATPSWLDALHVTGALRDYIRAVRGRGESLTKTPRITASTIHAVKGGEADNVVVDTKLTPNTWHAWMDGQADNETRVLFTAMSRAKNRLIFLNCNSPMNYQLEGLIR